jgi:hypothetical protein
VFDLTGKVVVVETGDMSYTGKLIKMDEDEVQIVSESGWVIIPTNRIPLSERTRISLNLPVRTAPMSLLR